MDQRGPVSSEAMGSFDLPDEFGNSSFVFTVSDIIDARVLSVWNYGHYDAQFHAVVLKETTTYTSITWWTMPTIPIPLMLGYTSTTVLN